MIDLEISLVEAFSWSLNEIDATDIETLLPFVRRYSARRMQSAGRLSAGGQQPQEKAFCDQVGWL